MGLTLVFAGLVSYFGVVFLVPWLPAVRNHAAPNWLLIAAGLLSSVTAMARTTSGRRLVPAALFALSLVLAGAFATILYVVSVVPPVSGPTLGVAAPDFTLADQTGKAVRSTDFRGAPLLLVFYRGHW